MDVIILEAHCTEESDLGKEIGSFIVGVFEDEEDAKSSIPYWKDMVTDWYDIGDFNFTVTPWCVRNTGDNDAD